MFRNPRRSKIVAVAIVSTLAILATVVQVGPRLQSEAQRELTMSIDPSIRPDVEALDPTVADTPVSVLAGSNGDVAPFVGDEFLVATDDPVALTRFAERHAGVVVESVAVAGGNDIHRVQVQPGTATGQAAANALAVLGPDIVGDHSVSDGHGAWLLQVAAEASASGLSVGVNWLWGQDDYFSDGAVAAGSARESMPGYRDSTTNKVSTDPFAWEYLRNGGPMDFGVTEAWRLLQQAGRLTPSSTDIAIIDGGFAENADLPGAPVTPKSALNKTNTGKCGGNPCPYHGTSVAQTAAGRLNNGDGTAGVAGPVADLALYDIGAMWKSGSLKKILTSGYRIAKTLLGLVASQPDAINISASVKLPAIAFLVDVIGSAVTEEVSDAGILIVASAGNDKRNVDATDCFIVCWEETFVLPCELDKVTCVGGVEKGQLTRDSDSAYGRKSVDYWAPYTVYVGPDPANAKGREANGTSYSAPFVSGAVALIRAANPSLSSGEVKSILTKSSRTVEKHRKVIDVEAAVRLALASVDVGLQIVNPTPAATVSESDFTVEFAAETTGHPGLADSVEWFLGKKSIGRGARLSLFPSKLGAFGSKVVTARLTTPGGAVLRDEVKFDFVRTAPVVEIVQPGDGAPVGARDAVHVVLSDQDGRYVDPTKPVTTWKVDGRPVPAEWFQDRRQLVVPPGALAPGRHRLAAEVSYAGRTVSDSVEVMVACPAGTELAEDGCVPDPDAAAVPSPEGRAPGDPDQGGAGNAAPSVAIVAPTMHSWFKAQVEDGGRTFGTFDVKAVALDVEDGTIPTDRIEWFAMCRNATGDEIRIPIGRGTGEVRVPAREGRCVVDGYVDWNLIAVATDSAGAVGESAPIPVVASHPPVL